jgi:PAS domain S-box-containing protein
VWTADIARHGTLPRARAAVKEGLHAAFATPAIRGNQVLGVLEFFGSEFGPRDDEFLDAMRAVGSQLGQFLERCQAARSLEYTVARNAAILAAAIDGIVTIDDQDRILEFNPAAERVLGYARHEALGRAIYELIIPTRPSDRHRQGLTRFFEDGQSRLLGRRVEMMAVNKQGEKFPVEVSITRIPVQYPPLFTVFLRDLRDHYRAEADRRESEQRNKLLAELTSDYTVSYTVRADGSILLDHVSEGFTDVTGFTLEDVTTTGDWQSIYAADDLPKVRASLRELLAGEMSYLDVRVKTKTDDVRWIRSLARPVFDEEQGRVTRIYAAAQDVTERLTAEKSLTLHSRVLENMTEGVSVMDENGWIVFTNPAEDKIFGYERGELIGENMSIQVALAPEESQRIVAGVIAHLKVHGDWNGEWENRRKDGTLFTTESRTTSLRVGSDLFFVCVKRDVTEQKKAASALRESERNAQEQLSLLDHVYRTAPVGMGLFDSQLRYVRVNELLASFDGRRPEDCLGKTIRDVIPEMADQLEPLYRHVFATGQPIVETEVTGSTPGTFGQDHHWLVNYHPVFGPEGNVMAVSAAVVDITQRKRAEDEVRASEQRFRSMADSAPVMIWLSDTDKSRTWFNRPWLQFTGRTMDEELGFDWSVGIHREDCEAYKAVFAKAFDARKEFRMEYRLRRRDGEYRWILDHGVPLYGNNDRFMGYIGSAIEIHDHRLAEQSLRDADTRKNEFVAMLAHELRNPLAIIQYAADISRLSEPVDSQSDWANTIESQVRHLARLVDDLLDLSRLTRGKIAIRPEFVDAATVVHRAVEGLNPLIEEREQHLVLDLPMEPITLFADETRLAQVIQNLLTNATKYSEPGGRIVVSLKNENDQAVISVIDDGAGMPANLIPYVFDLFRQGERTLDRAQGGLGIGLTLVREIVQLHGGTVHAHSDGVGRGSCFTIKLPVHEPSRSLPDLEKDTTVRSGKSLRVMVVEDNVDAARGMQLLLQAEGHHSLVCHSGSEAVRVARDFMPDVVLLDLGLPGKDGYQVAAEMRHDEALRDVLIIAISGYGESPVQPYLAETGIDHHLVKPVSFDSLRSLLTRELEQRAI